MGDNKLLPEPDSSCLVINCKSGFVRENRSWVIGRLMRDFEHWGGSHVEASMQALLEKGWQERRHKAEAAVPGSGKHIERPVMVGLCVVVYKALNVKARYPGYDRLYISGLIIMVLQFGIAAIPLGLFGDWSIFLVTGAGTLLSIATGYLPQWRKEKWSCRAIQKQQVVITRGSGHQYAIVIINDHKGTACGLNLEDLAGGPLHPGRAMSLTTRNSVITFALLWILLLITAAGIKQNTWFLVAVGGLGILQNIFAAGATRSPEAFGIPLTLDRVYAETQVLDTLHVVEEALPGVGKSMLSTFFPGHIRTDGKDYSRLGL